MAIPSFDGTEKEDVLINLLNQLVDGVNDAGGGAGGGTTYYIDSSDGAGVYGVLAGTINGVNTTFTVAQSAYTTGTLKVWWQGQLQTGSQITETTAASGIFDLSFAPTSGTSLMVEYA